MANVKLIDEPLRSQGEFGKKSRWKNNLLALVALSIFVKISLVLLPLRQWGDESETIVTAKLIISGQRLYTQIFNHHGPLAFLNSLAMEFLGVKGTDIALHRTPVLILEILLLVAIYNLNSRRDQTVAIVVAGFSALALIAASLFSLLNTDTYQSYSALFLGLGLAIWIMPAVESGRTAKVSDTIGGALVGSLPFLAIWYLPAVLVLFAVALNKVRSRRWPLFGAAIPAIAFIVSFFTFASPIGYFTDHVLVNAIIMPKYRPINLGLFMPSGMEFMLFFCVPIGILGTYLLIFRSSIRKQGMPRILIVCALVSFLSRGINVQALPLFVGALAVLPSSISKVFEWCGTRFRPEFLKKTWASLALTTTSVLGLLLILLLASPPGIKLLKYLEIPAKSQFSEYAAKITLDSDRVLAYPFNNYEYLRAERLPASGNFFYLPWQSDPRLKRFPSPPIDTCFQIATKHPKLIQIEDSDYWRSYSGCIMKEIRQFYTRIPGTNIYRLR